LTTMDCRFFMSRMSAYKYGPGQKYKKDPFLVNFNNMVILERNTYI